MEPPSTVEKLRQLVELEEASDDLNTMPPDTYIKLSSYAQKLHATTTPSGDDAPARLAKKQLWLIEVMTTRLLQVRLEKASRHPSSAGNGARSNNHNLLPEEKYIDGLARQLAIKQERFVQAVVDGQSSFFTTVQVREAQMMTTVRMSKRVGEIIGADLKRYGPFEVNDVVRLPAGNAQAMVANKQAVLVSSDEF